MNLKVNGKSLKHQMVWWECFKARSKCPKCGKRMKKTGAEKSRIKSLGINKSEIYTNRTFYSCGTCNKEWVHDRTMPQFKQMVEIK